MRNNQAAHACAGQPVRAPYPALDALQQKRLTAKRYKTAYCYDWPSVFRTALQHIWDAYEMQTGTTPAGKGADLETVLLHIWKHYSSSWHQNV